jgi:Tol biopolymer transport system component
MNMSDLSERLHGIDSLDAPNLIADAYRRADNGGGTGRDPGRNGRTMTIVVAAIIGLAGVAVAAWAFGRAEEQTTPAAAQQAIIYTSVPFPDTPAQLYSMRPDGSDVTQLTHDTASYFDAALSPDGSRLAFVRLQTEGTRDEGIYVGNPDGSNATEIYTSTETPQSVLDLQWSPDGSTLAFVLRSIPPGGGSEADFTQRLWVMGTDGSDLHLVSHDQITSFSWDPTGEGFAVTKEFVSGGGFIDAIFTIALDGTTTGQLTSREDAHDPVWSPDGRQIMYQAGWADAVHLMVMDADGSNAHAVPLQWDGWSDPLTWSPDSQQVLVAAGNDQHECATLLVDASSGASTVLLQGTTMLAPASPGEPRHATGYPCVQSATWLGGAAETAPTSTSESGVDGSAAPTSSTYSPSVESSPGAAADIVCNEDGTTTMSSDVLTATAEGVPLHVWSPDANHMLWVPLQSWMPFDNQWQSLSEGMNSVVLVAPPGPAEIDCIAGPHGDTLDPTASARVTIVDPQGFFGPAAVDCAQGAAIRFGVSVTAQAGQGGLPPDLSLEQAVNTYLTGVAATDEIRPALYPEGVASEAVSILRDGHVLALVTRTSADVPMPLHVVTCPGSGVSHG